jgi:hypothetical protein
MPWPTATAGVVGVPCSSATHRTTLSAARRAAVPLIIQRGLFPERGAAGQHEELPGTRSPAAPFSGLLQLPAKLFLVQDLEVIQIATTNL